MRRFSTAVLTLSLALSVFAGTARADFSDLSPSNEHYVAVSALVTQEVLQGYADGSFKPDQSVNRAEALKIILKGSDVEVLGGAAALVFSDVQEADWFLDYVGTAVTLGIVQGYEDGTFKPEQNVSRAEALKMLLVAAKMDIPEVDSSYNDVQLSDWFAAYASASKQWNLAAPQTDGLWHGEEALTRGELAEMVYRLQQVKVSGNSFDESTNWLRTSFETVDVSMKVPFGWGIKTEGVGAAFLLDQDGGQLSLLSPYENGGTLLMTRYSNPQGKSVTALFNALRAQIQLPSEEVSFGDLEALVIEHHDGTTYREWYVALPNGTLVNLLALRGEGPYEKYLEWYLSAMVGSIEYVPSTSSDLSVEEVLTQLRAAIQVDGVGKDLMDLLTDWQLIETDAIGVGTGPVDYYYSPSAKVTVKYERSYDVILDLRDGQTSAF